MPNPSGQSYKCGRCGAYLMFHDSVCDCHDYTPDYGAMEIVEDDDLPQEPSEPGDRELEGYARRAQRYGSDFLDHDHSMDY